MNEQLLLDNIRGTLARLEETIIFGLIERAQFRRNEIIYRPDAFGPPLGGECLLDYMLHETERLHARMRRYTSPDEHPFFHDLPAPVLPALRYDESPLRPNTININPRIRSAYETAIVPHICRPGDDGQYGSGSVGDVHCLQAISRRIHYGKFVAEGKYRACPELFRPLIRARDAGGLLAAITDAQVEDAVLDRVRKKAQAYSVALAANADVPCFAPETVADIYARWIIPLNKDVQVLYLLEAVGARP